MSNKRLLKLNEFIAHGAYSLTSCSIGHKCNRIVATGGEDKRVNLWTLNKPTCIMSLTGHTSSINSITFSSEEDKLVSGSASGSLKVWDLEANKLICNLVGHKANVTCLEYHTYADYIASGSIDAQIRLWDLRRKGCIFNYKGHSNAINSLKFSPDSRWIASASDDCLIKIWDLKAGRLLIDLKGHSSSVNTLEFHPNEFLLATGSSDRTVKFWDLEKMENVSTSPPAPNPVKVIAFDPSGRCLFSASQDYLQSLSWEPSKCYDSVYCQWKQIADMTISSNKLIAASTFQNMVSFHAVDLLQVAPIGQSTGGDAETTKMMNELRLNDKAAQVKSMSAASSTRRNFHHEQRIEASEQPDESLSAEPSDVQTSVDNSHASIYDQEEYNKIFRPKNQIQRAMEAQSRISNAEPQVGKKLSARNEPTTPKDKNAKLAGENKANAVDKSFFIDIKVAPQPPPLPQPPQVQVQPPLVPLPPIEPQQQQQPQLQQQAAMPSDLRNVDDDGVRVVNEPELSYLKAREDDARKVDLSPPTVPSPRIVNAPHQHQPQQHAQSHVELIEKGHEPFMKALQIRKRNIQMVRSMWTNGNVKSALDAAVSINDNSLIADILGQINNSPAVWNLDICTILLPSIRDLINTKYEEYMQVGSDSCKLICKNFGKLIKANLSSHVSVGVDITREERQRKCNSCYTYLLEIVAIVERKLPGIVSSKLSNNFREINLLMKTIDN